MGKRLPYDVLNEAVKLRMEGDSYREIAAKLHLRSHTSLEPHLKGVTKGVKKGPSVIEVPVSVKQEQVAETEKPTGDTRVGPSDKSVSAVAEATLELAGSLRAFKEELVKRGVEDRPPPSAGSYAYSGGGMTARMMEDEIGKLKANAKAEHEAVLGAVKTLAGRLEVVETRVTALIMKSMQ